MFVFASSIIPVAVEPVELGKKKRRPLKPERNSLSVSGDVDRELGELCKAIRLMSERDTDGTVVEVFRTVLYKRGEPIGSTEISRVSRLNRITCIHHLKRLASMGIVENDSGKYRLRHDSVEDIIEQMRENTLAMFADMEELARKIDVEIGSETTEKQYVERNEKRAVQRIKARK